MPRPSKPALRAELLAALEQALATARAAHEQAASAATHDEARPENSKDTRGLEQSYLARGHAQRVSELELAVAAIAAMPVRACAPGEPAGPGALVSVDDDGRTRDFLLAPHGGGLVLANGVTVVTPTSPIGRALLGRRVGDECELTLAGKPRLLVVDAIT